MEISIDHWHYPIIPRSKFPEAMPRYPNVWFYFDRNFLPTSSEALHFLFDLFNACSMYRVFWRPPFEGADGEAARDHWQPNAAFTNPLLAHEHSMHLRYFISPLNDTIFTVSSPSESWDCLAIATSVHFEPGGYVHYLPMEEYPELETCPYCGRRDKNIAFDAVYEKIRDPLGRELFIDGTINGQRITDAFGRESRGLKELADDNMGRFIQRIDTVNGYFTEGINTPRISCLLIHA